MRYFDDQELENVFSNQTCESCHFFDDGLKECWLQEGTKKNPGPSGCHNWRLHRSLEARVEELMDNHQSFGKK